MFENLYYVGNNTVHQSVRLYPQTQYCGLGSRLSNPTNFSFLAHCVLRLIEGEISPRTEKESRHFIVNRL